MSVKNIISTTDKIKDALQTRPFRIVLAALLIITGITMITVYCIVLFGSINSRGADNIELTITRGMTPQAIASLLEEQAVIQNKKQFLLGAKLMGVSRKLQAGTYLFQGSQTTYSVLTKLYKGDVITERITFPEGTRAAGMAAILEKTYHIDSSHFMALVNDTEFTRSLGISAHTLEGYLYPDTYHFPLNPTVEEIIKKMVQQFMTIWDDKLEKQAEKVNLTTHEVITLASIVEGEAALDSERNIISALYLNRLKRNMRLQADPTIQYIIPNGPRRLLNKDLLIDSPYNTYLYKGLPPGPVNNPGSASIQAVLYPASVEYLYMVANGDGSHTFSLTIRDHLKAKQRFDNVRRQVRRQGR